MGAARWSAIAFCLALIGAGKDDPIRHAEDNLVKEYELFLRYPDTTIRTSCSYFHDYPAADLTGAKILDALNDSVSDDGRVACYVRWQLMSGGPNQFPAELARQAVAMYRAAPALVARPQERELDPILQLSRREDEGAMNVRLENLIALADRNNLSNLNYRDELYDHLPDCAAKFICGLEDAAGRLDAGVPGEKFLAKVVNETSNWIDAGKADVAALTALDKAVGILRMHKAPQYPKAARWDGHVMRWVAMRPSLNHGRQLDKLAQLIQNTRDKGSG